VLMPGGAAQWGSASSAWKHTQGGNRYGQPVPGDREGPLAWVLFVIAESNVDLLDFDGGRRRRPRR
jgi:hypothetical protein